MTKFNIVCPDPTIRMTDYEIEQFLLFAIAVAGKTAKTVARQLDEFLALEEGSTPFQKIRSMLVKHTLKRNLKKVHLGRYNVLTRAYTELVSSKLNLRKCTIDELEAIHGIGNKTSRFFVMYAQGRNDIAVLDTHILKFIKKHASELGYNIVVPISTPSGKNYRNIEAVYLTICKFLKVDPQKLDTAIWTEYSGNESSNRIRTIT